MEIPVVVKICVVGYYKRCIKFHRHKIKNFPGELAQWGPLPLELVSSFVFGIIDQVPFCDCRYNLIISNYINIEF